MPVHFYLVLSPIMNELWWVIIQMGEGRCLKEVRY